MWITYHQEYYIIFHEYLRNDKPKYWNDKQIKFNDKKAIKKIKYYLYNYDEYNNDPYYSNYKLGKIRSLESYFKYAKIDINNIKHKNNFFSLLYSLSYSLFLIVFLIFIVIYFII